ncbi:coil containing protein [Vibrio phage 1.170.O._10N.261.52.C3]|nr:coil containing protein [Vibrio phage 1.170.O._10N.261.52.C3]
MSKKILVTKEWHKKAMEALEKDEKEILEMQAYVGGLQNFLLTKLTPEQQNQLEKEIQDWMETYEEHSQLK